MKLKRLACALLLTLLVLPLAARADVLIPGQKPPRNEQSEAFVALYQAGITGWDSAYDNAFDGVEQVVLWRYPGSGIVVGETDSWLVDETGRARLLDPCYVDGEGRFWGYLHYAGSVRQVWVCVSDPANTKLAAEESVVTAVEKEVKAVALRESLPIIALVAGVVVVTGGLIYVLWYKKKKA